MVHLPAVRACIDRYEALSEDGTAEAAQGRLPTNGISWNDADAACRNAGFRLCTRPEWMYACSGTTAEEGGRAFVYGDEYEQERCNSAEDGTSVTDRALAPGGGFPRCVSPEGAYDMSGNISEWIDATDATGTLRELRGGDFAAYEKYAHCVTSPLLFQPLEAGLEGYGFRCCTDAR
jgi:formylglycine-generating enzyme required for sulfatase activity